MPAGPAGGANQELSAALGPAARAPLSRGFGPLPLYRLVPFTTSAGIPQNLVLPPAKLLEVARDAEVQNRLRTQVERMLYVGGPDRVVEVAVRGLPVMWLVAVGMWAVAGRAWFPLALLVSLPVSFPRRVFRDGGAVLLAGARSSGGARQGASGARTDPATLSGAGRVASR